MLVPAYDEPELVVSGPNAWWQIGELTPSDSAAVTEVYDTQTAQHWDGFGGTFNEKGWVALQALSDADRARALELLFGQDGARFTHARIPVGASDYALDRYSLNDTAGDFAMEHFSIDRDRQALIPYIKAALAVNPDIWFWASPWSPPPWMKDNNAFDRGNMKNDEATLAAHALYLARFVEEYALEGIPIRAIHPQNEPGFGQDYPSCAWTSSQMASYISGSLGPTFMSRGIGTQIWMGTMSNETLDSQLAKAVLGDSAARPFLSGIGLQWGLRAHVSEFTQYNLPIWQTEHQAGNNPWEHYDSDVASSPEKTAYMNAPAPNDDAYAIEGWDWMRDWINGGVNGYMAWNMVLDTEGRSLDTVRPWNQNALLAVNTASHELIVTPTYFVFRHFSEFVDPGAVRLKTSDKETIAFKNPDGSIAAVMFNQNAQPVESLVGIAATTYRVTLPGHGWATLNVKP